MKYLKNKNNLNVKLGAHSLDLDKKTLYFQGEEINIEPLTMDVLCYLVTNHSEYVTLDELHDNIWANRIVSDSAVRRTIVKIRSIFGDNYLKPKYIKSTARKGYKFIHPIEQGLTRHSVVEQQKYSLYQRFITKDTILMLLILIQSSLIFYTVIFDL